MGTGGRVESVFKIKKFPCAHAPLHPVNVAVMFPRPAFAGGTKCRHTQLWQRSVARWRGERRHRRWGLGTSMAWACRGRC